MAAQRFPIRLGSRSRPVLLLLFGVRDSNAYVDLGDTIDAQFGFFHFSVPLANVSRWQLEGPWRWVTAIGVRRSIRDHDVTFGGNHRGGVRLDFHQPVRWSLLTVPALYLTVADMDAFAAALAERGIPGADLRKDRQ